MVELRNYSRFIFVENTIGNLLKILRTKLPRSDRLFCFIRIWKFGNFNRTILKQLLACLNFILDSDLFCWYKGTKWFLWTMAAAQAAENHGDEWGLTWYLRWGIYKSKPWNNHQPLNIDQEWCSFVRRNFFNIGHNNWQSIIGKRKEKFEMSYFSNIWNIYVGNYFLSFIEHIKLCKIDSHMLYKKLFCYTIISSL